jgi:hypothetical protein
MTPHQTFAVAALGGFAAVFSLAVFAGLAIGLHAAFRRLLAAHEARQERRRLLATCNAINALPTTNHPKD